VSNFIVLGIIPGTNLQIGLFGWLAVFAAVSSLFVIRRVRKSQFLHYIILRISLAQSVRQATNQRQQA
jgi:hypothetical protein